MRNKMAWILDDQKTLGVGLPEEIPPEKKFPYWTLLFAPLLLIPFLKKKK